MRPLSLVATTLFRRGVEGLPWESRGSPFTVACRDMNSGPAKTLREETTRMHGFVESIEDLAVKNTDFRRVLYTAKHCQLVLMALKAGEEIGAEVHTARPVLSRGGRHRRGRPRWRPNVPPGGLRDRRSRRSEAQHHQHRDGSVEALHPLFAAESSRRRRPPARARTPRPTPSTSTARRRNSSPATAGPVVYAGGVPARSKVEGWP